MPGGEKGNGDGEEGKLREYQFKLGFCGVDVCFFVPPVPHVSFCVFAFGFGLGVLDLHVRLRCLFCLVLYRLYPLYFLLWILVFTSFGSCFIITEDIGVHGPDSGINIIKEDRWMDSMQTVTTDLWIGRKEFLVFGFWDLG